ncbi:MAG: radical SAM family heme chaperone HemW [Woeseiaceae bacterium]|nr:radical SAM family heme chaperone HemW [Woeseiaceae bacterium]
MGLTLPAAPPLSLYIHLPWCVRKCPYCDFNSWTMGADAPLDRYVDALLIDLAAEAQRASGRELVSVFIGGGTPSVFSAAQVGAILDTVADRFSLAPDIEVTMEANPGTVEAGDPAGYREAGVNRLSLGAQSFSPEALQALGRIHSVEDIRRSVDAARRAGFDNLNLDIMYGLPGQSVAGAMSDLADAAGLEPEHLSWYHLTLEPNTVFHARPPQDLPDEDTVAEIQSQGQAVLTSRGFEQYEVSAYARPGRHCRHNLNYWTYGDYLAAGAGAHGKITDSAGIWRYAKPAHPKLYVELLHSGEAAAEPRLVSEPDRLFEYLLNAVRLRDEVSVAEFSARTGLSAAVLEQRMQNPLGNGLVAKSGQESWRVTALGRRFLNDLQAEFLPD